jgi:hypothetical protein
VDSAAAGYIALDVSAATGQDPGTLRFPYLGMDRIARYVIVPLALASLVTGLVGTHNPPLKLRGFVPHEPPGMCLRSESRL